MAGAIELLRAPLRDAIERAPAGALGALRGKSVAITGATGFFGAWVLLAIDELNASRALNLRAVALSRSPSAFAARFPALAASPWLSWVQADAAGFATPLAACDYTLHMAASSSQSANFADPLACSLSIAHGTASACELARLGGGRLLMVSSGAVYGPRRLSEGPARESQAARGGADPLDPKAAYGEAKRYAESLCAAHAAAGLSAAVARPFAFLGPLLPLRAHFAAGAFLLDAAEGRSPAPRDGSPWRSWQHPADLALWLLCLLALAPSGEAFNVGGDEEMPIGELARHVARAAGLPEPASRRRELGEDPSMYVPDLSKAHALGLLNAIGLDRAIASTLEWIAACPQGDLP